MIVILPDWLYTLHKEMREKILARYDVRELNKRIFDRD